jgi:PTS system ascorbate-specific IIA component
MKISQEHHLNMVQDRMEEFIYLILFMQNRTCKVELEFSEREERLLGNQWLYPISEKLVQAVFNSGEECEVYFWESRLLGIVQGESSFSDQEFFNTLTEQVLMNAQVLVGLDYSESKELKETLYQHIVPAYFRIIFDVYYENPLLEKVKKEYRELFEITRRALQPLEKEVNRKISESEIAYFTIHFGGYLKRKAEPDRIKAAVVCPNGISSSLIMASTIRETFPELEIIRVHSIDTMKDTVLHDIEIVFSTTYFSTEKAIYVTNPILNPVEKEILREQVSSDFPSLPKPQPILTSDVLKIMEKHGTITNKQALIQELQHYLYRTNRVEEKGMKNLPDILDESLIQVTDEKMEWKGAIEKAAQPLLKQGYIEEAYVEAMIETVESIGPYIVLAPKVAVPHARPERGVKQLGISLLKLSEPVDFNVIGEEDPERYVQLVFVLAAVDGEAHLKALMQLSRILEDEDHIEALIQLDEPKELYNKIQHLVETEGGA